jgi:hypothetical protein
MLNLTPGAAAPPGEAGGRDRLALPAEGGLAARRPSHLDSVRCGQQHQVRYTLITAQRIRCHICKKHPVLGDGTAG